ncbi:MAG: metalloregulator ArsR/SmtB family transcription factor [Pseudomonadales bacterium]
MSAAPKLHQSSELLALCKASADQFRLDILRVLRRDSYGVQEICDILGQKQSGVSHHLKILAKTGLVSKRREGNTIFYRRASVDKNHPLMEIHHALLNAVDTLELPADVLLRINAIQTQRGVSSQHFFAEHAQNFRQQQEQIAEYRLYGTAMADLLARCSPENGSLALEIGPGEGVFLAELSPRFKLVYALDNSPEMLAQAEHFTEKHGLQNVRFIHGDTRDPGIQAMSFNCVVANMVLHHIPSPADVFQDVSKILHPQGQFLVTELCAHDQSWAQDACGDVWLGFEPEDVSLWAAQAGLSEGESIYLAQRNGFRVQIRQFIKN